MTAYGILVSQHRSEQASTRSGGMGNSVTLRSRNRLLYGQCSPANRGDLELAIWMGLIEFFGHLNWKRFSA